MRAYRQGTEEKRRYAVDFQDRLDAGDGIASVTWTVDNGITTSLSDYDDRYAYITANGGTEGTSYEFQAVVTTSEGRKHERTFIVQVVDR
jgi:hypothetical protein